MQFNEGGLDLLKQHTFDNNRNIMPLIGFNRGERGERGASAASNVASGGSSSSPTGNSCLSGQQQQQQHHHNKAQQHQQQQQQPPQPGQRLRRIGQGLAPLRAFQFPSFTSRNSVCTVSTEVDLNKTQDFDLDDDLEDEDDEVIEIVSPYKAIGEQCHFGATSYQCGSYVEACGHFYEALRLLSKVEVSCMAEASCVSAALHQDITLDMATSSSSPIEEEEGRTGEYDEGMRIYNDVVDLHVYDEDSESAIDEDPVKAYRHTACSLLFNMGQCYSRQGGSEAFKAHTYYDQALVLCNLGQDSNVQNGAQRHLCVMVLHKVAQYYYSRGDQADALKRLKHAFDVLVKHGENDVSTDNADLASTLNALGVLYYHEGLQNRNDGGRMATAQDLLDEAFRLRLRVSGREHPSTATVLNNMSRLCVHQKRHEEALRGYTEALRIRKLVYGWKHVDVAATTYNLGQTYHLLGRDQQALRCYKEFVAVATHLYGESHKDVSMVLSLMAEIHQERGQRDTAMEYFTRSLHCGVAAYGPNHVEVALLYNKMGTCLLEMERVADSIEAYERGLQVERQVLDHGHPNIFITLCNIGELYKQLRDFDKARDYFCQTMMLRFDQLAQQSELDSAIVEHLRFLLVTNPHAGVEVPGIFDVSAELRQLLSGAEATDATENLYTSLAETVNDVADALFKGGKDRLALKYLRYALVLRIFVQGELSKDVAVTVHNIALIFQFMGRYDEALQCCSKSLQAMTRLFGSRDASQHEYIGMTQHLMGQLHLQRRDFAVALQTLKQALEVQKRARGEHDASVARILADIGKACHELRDYDGMMSSFTEAARIYRLCGLSVDNLGIETQKMLAVCGQMDDSRNDQIHCAPAA